MKKILSFLLVAMLTLGLSACKQGEKPEKVVKNYFTSIKSGDVDTAKKLVEGGDDENKDVNEEDKELAKKIFSNISAEIVGDAKVEGETATVNAKVTAPDMKKILGKVMGEAFPKIMKEAFEGKERSEEEKDKLVEEYFVKQLESKDLAMVTSEVELNLVKKDNSWVIKEDEALQNALSGGFSKDFKSLENKLK